MNPIFSHNENNNKFKLLPLFSKRILYPGIILHLQLNLDWFNLQHYNLLDFVACVPIYPSSNSTTENTTIIKPLLLKQKEIKFANYGCLGRIVKLNRILINNHNVVVIFVQGISRLGILELDSSSFNNNNNNNNDDLLISAKVNILIDKELSIDDEEGKSLEQTLRHQTVQLMSFNNTIPTNVIQHINHLIKSTAITHLTYIISNLFDTSLIDRITMLSLDTKQRIIRSVFTIQSQLDSLSNNSQPDQDPYPINNKARSIQLQVFNQLNNPDSTSNEVEILMRQLDNNPYPTHVANHLRKDLKRLQTMNPNMTEYHMLLNYVDIVLHLPWTIATTDRIDLRHAQAHLDQDHFGLFDVKKRIIQYLAVRKLNNSLKGPILCLHGPPGTGKTSIAKSVADAMNRKFERVALGGVRDESEIRGHRRTYVGAMPGVIIQALRRCKSRNPVIILDEVDKLGHDMIRGDPSSALLEVLDPEQNATFKDHYIQLEFDLSQVLFIATCNATHTIPKPLLDRMEIIELQGYSPSEKRDIAQNKLLPKQLVANGLSPHDIVLSNSVLDYIVLHYTHEAGVRALERCLGSICRSVAVDHVQSISGLPTTNQNGLINQTGDDDDPKPKQQMKQRILKESDIDDILGPNKFDLDLGLSVMMPGIAHGLAWTGTGTGVVMLIETSKYPGTGKIQLTGQLGSVLQESAALALTWLRTHAYALGLVLRKDALLWADQDLHIHLPSGSTKKDGPSAGVALVVALTSLAMNVPARTGVAMTGEISLRGAVHPVGGIKEKSIAAYVAGMHTILIPKRNAKDIALIPIEVRQSLRIVLCDQMSQVLFESLESTKEFGALVKQSIGDPCGPATPAGAEGLLGFVSKL